MCARSPRCAPVRRYTWQSGGSDYNDKVIIDQTGDNDKVIIDQVTIINIVRHARARPHTVSDTHPGDTTRTLFEQEAVKRMSNTASLR